jgi:hypothetical protein
MNDIARRFLTPLLVAFLAASLAGCYTLLKRPAVTDDSEDTRIIYYSIEPFPPIIPEPQPILPWPPDPPEPPPPPPEPLPVRPIDPKEPIKKQQKEEPSGKKILERQSSGTRESKEK